MKPFIDVHAHVLPGVDDGAADWDESRRMLTCAYEQGIRTIIATPHYSHRQDAGKLQEAARQLDWEARAIAPDYNIFLGQEILYFDSLVEKLKEGQALTMAGSRYVLTEFMPRISFSRLYQAVRSLTVAGYYPIIAHVERYEALRGRNKMEELAGTGCYLQMNYKSLEGSLLDGNARWCRRQVLEGRIHFLGTDAHRMDIRPPEIAKSLEWLKQHVTEDCIADMTRENAVRIIGRKN